MTTFHKTADTLIDGAMTLPRYYYTDKNNYEREINSIFHRSWISCTRSSELINPGAFIALNLGDESIIVLRDGTHQLRAFYNICRHRGTRICTQNSGRFSKSIQCGYHGWTYHLNGDLIGAPHMEAVDGFEKSNYPLFSIPLLEWDGFIFLNLSDEPPKTMGEAFNKLQHRFSAWKINELKTYKKISYDVQCNWKLILQNYSECYHCPLIHPQLADKTPYTSGRNDMTAGPILGGYMDVKTESISASGGLCGPVLPDLSEENKTRVYYYSIFPNMMISLHPDYVMVHQVWPVDTQHCKIDCTWLFPENAIGNTHYNPQSAVDFWDKTNRQDWQICEQSMQGILSKKYVPGPYSGQESLLAAFDQYYLKKLGE